MLDHEEAERKRLMTETKHRELRVELIGPTTVYNHDRLNDQWRLIVLPERNEEGKSVLIVDIEKHYQRT